MTLTLRQAVRNAQQLLRLDTPPEQPQPTTALYHVGDAVTLPEGIYVIDLFDRCPYVTVPAEYVAYDPKGMWVYLWRQEAFTPDAPLCDWMTVAALVLLVENTSALITDEAEISA